MQSVEISRMLIKDGFYFVSTVNRQGGVRSAEIGEL
jgi:hypothetical protein